MFIIIIKFLKKFTDNRYIVMILDLASLQTFGNQPFEIERLKLALLYSDGASLSAVDLRTHPEMPSGPLALDTSRPAIKVAISSGEYK